MSKPISISFGKSKTSLASGNTHPTRKLRTAQQIAATKPRLLGHDSDDEDEPKQPVHEAVTGFAADGAILGEQRPEKEQTVIKNSGNSDWRKRRRAEPGEVQAQNGITTVVEKDEVSKASGLSFAKKDESTRTLEVEASETTAGNGANLHVPTQERTEDENALQALLADGEGGSKSTAVIIPKDNANLVRQRHIDEDGDFRADVSERPGPPTLADYEAMPVEDFGLALLRGMGPSGKVGKIANPSDARATVPKIPVPRSGLLGIGATATPGAESELGAWDKAAMRKGMKSKTGNGGYNPVILRDKRTGEVLTEEQLQARMKAAKESLNGREEDRRERRDKNLERSGREKGGDQKRLMEKDDDYRDRMHDFSRHSASHKDERNGSSRSDRSRSRDRRRRDDDSRDEKYRDRSRNGDRDRRRDKYRDDDRYDSGASRKSSHRDGEKNGYDKNEDRRRRERH